MQNLFSEDKLNAPLLWYLDHDRNNLRILPIVVYSESESWFYDAIVLPHCKIQFCTCIMYYLDAFLHDLMSQNVFLLRAMRNERLLLEGC